VIVTSSNAGVYGSFGQANYSSGISFSEWETKSSVNKHDINFAQRVSQSIINSGAFNFQYHAVYNVD
jgi:hypothetical protein